MTNHSTSTDYTAWPYEEARKILEKIEREEAAGRRKHADVLFETGFGPSGLPHIGTFSEVARTLWVRYAFEKLSGMPTRLYSFSDDLDGLRKIPENIPNQDMILPHLGKPLCDIPDPFGEAESFSGYMNAKLRSFLDSFGFQYEFKASSEQYRSGAFNEGLLKILERYDAVRDIILPTLRPENREVWSPFFPICQNCGKVNSTRVTATHPDSGEISYVCDQDYKNIPSCGHHGRISVCDGNAKVGWKVDWALRWYVFGVDYEMYGKDLIESAELSGQIVRALGGEPPEGLFYEMFLDENGQKISKSVGKGLTIDEWLEYGPLESLSWFLFQSPRKAKKLHFDVIPQSVDKFLEDRQAFGRAEANAQADNAVWFIEHDKIKAGQHVNYEAGVSYSMLLNLVNVLGTDDKQIVWDYLLRYNDDARKNEAMIDDMIDRALRYHRDFVVPTLKFVQPTDEMRAPLAQYRAFLVSYGGNDPEVLQNACYQAGKDHGVKLGQWFATLYQLLLGQRQGPRIGTFVSLYGVQETVALIDQRLDISLQPAESP